MSLRDQPFAHTRPEDRVGRPCGAAVDDGVVAARVGRARASHSARAAEPSRESRDGRAAAGIGRRARARHRRCAWAASAPGDLVATVDLSSAQPGRRLFHLSPERVKAPFAVAVTQVTPSSVAIRFEPSATRIVPVPPSVEGEPAPGFIVGKISADPATVEVVGPESVLRRVTEAITEPLWVGSAAGRCARRASSWASPTRVCG